MLRRRNHPAVFKGNKVVVRRNRKLADGDVTAESPQFQLLARLFVPAQLLIKNNTVSRKQLGAFLPPVAPPGFDDLNFEIHIFLSSIVTAYVSSWHGKLNTDNMDFVSKVYQGLCDFVQAVGGRVVSVAANGSFLSLTNELAAILAQHVRDNTVENGVPNYAREMLENGRWQATDLDPNYLRRTYLETHVSFENIDTSGPGENDQKTNLESNESESLSESHRVYLRNLVLTLLQATFGPAGPNTSTIVTNLLCVVLGDLVLEKTVLKLSSPQFVLDLFHSGASKIHKSPQNTPETVSAWARAQNAARSVYSVVGAVVGAWKSYSWNGTPGPSVLFSPVWSLLDAASAFSARKSVVAHILSSVRAVLFATSAGPKLDSLAAAFLANKLHNSSATDDAALANLVASLRDKLFGNSPGKKEDPHDVESVANELWEALSSTKIPSWFPYKSETEEEMRQSLESVVQIFMDSEMNQLVVFKLLDCVVMHLYPETTEPITNSFE